jgi:Zn-dependent membrane protease YugP
MLDITYIVFILPAVIFTLIAQSKVKSAYRKYSRVDSKAGITGAEVAKMILKQNNIYDVTVQRGRGVLTDHFDPANSVVRLSEGVYDSTSVAALSIAAHEIGHVVQKEEGYFPYNFRTALVPVANLGSSVSWLLIVLSIILQWTGMLKLGIILFSAAVLFQIVTLPVEFNASNRALEFLSEGIMPEENIKYSKKVLSAAALTYVAAAATAILQLVRILVLTRNSRD